MCILIDQVRKTYATLRKEAPNAKIIASTFDSFRVVLDTVRDKLPRVSSEIGQVVFFLDCLLFSRLFFFDK